jgi:hypothetical protein
LEARAVGRREFQVKKLGAAGKVKLAKERQKRLAMLKDVAQVVASIGAKLDCFFQGRGHKVAPVDLGKEKDVPTIVEK